jgi:3-oxoacyl-[acyl-carrier protein] reductase
MAVLHLCHEAVQNIPIGRMVEAEDIASLMVFLVSAQASAITGQVIAVDGGAGRGIFY